MPILRGTGMAKVLGGGGSKLNNGLLLYYNMNDLNESSGKYGGVLTAISGAVITGGVGRIGGAGVYAGTDDAHWVENDGSLSVGPAFTLSCWLYPTSGNDPATQRTAWGFGITNSVNVMYVVGLNNQNDVRFNLDQATTGFQALDSSPISPTINKWYFACATYENTGAAGVMQLKVGDEDGGALDPYDKGALNAEDINVSVPYDGTIGGGGSATTPPAIGNEWLGRVDMCGLWNRKLTDAEIVEVYNLGAGREAPF